MKNFLIRTWSGFAVAITVGLVTFCLLNVAPPLVEAQGSVTAVVVPDESTPVGVSVAGMQTPAPLPVTAATVAAVLPTQAPVERKIAPAPEFDMKGSIFKMIQGLALCVGLLLLLVWLQKRTQRKSSNGSGRALKVVERLQTGGKTQVLLISVRGREYLIGQGSDSVNIYGEVVHDELIDEEVAKKI